MYFSAGIKLVFLPIFLLLMIARRKATLFRLDENNSSVCGFVFSSMVPKYAILEKWLLCEKDVITG